MITRRVLLGSATGLMLPLTLAEVAAAAMAAQQKPAATRKPVFQHDLPDIAMKGWSVTVVEVNYGPGDSSGAHRHPGITLACVLEGEVRSKVNDGPEKTYAAGEMWIEMPNDLHAVSANASTTKPAKLLAVLMAEKGKPLTTPAAE
jgi:quercetin dioxygenase-like cupin family protein